jgi:hypothetical protein
MVNFYNVNALGQNLTNFCPILRFVISGNFSKNGCVCATQWPTYSELKIKLDPSLDRSWCEFFKIIKVMVQKNPPPGCNLGPKFFPLALSCKISIQQTAK